MKSRPMRFGFGLALTAGLLVACGDGAGPVEISAVEGFRFNPDAVTVRAGEEVTFVVTNDDEIAHEFVLGPEHVQMAHEEAAAMDMEHAEMEVEGQLAAFNLDPGESREVTVTFDEPGEMLFGCHVPGHYPAGMVGTVTIE
jgi:uncharacterized cupredoxin-like copper-binding protein